MDFIHFNVPKIQNPQNDVLPYNMFYRFGKILKSEVSLEILDPCVSLLNFDRFSKSNQN